MMWKKVNEIEYKFEEGGDVLGILVVERMRKDKEILLQRVILSIGKDKRSVINEQVIAMLPVDEEHEISEEHLRIATKSLIEYYDKLITLMNYFGVKECII